MEMVDIRDLEGNLTGAVKEREAVHTDGDLHGTVHIWVARQNPETAQVELLLQKRSKNKDAFPGCYDISSAGHLESGDDFLPAAIRELKEELGIEAAADDLHFVFTHLGYAEAEFYGKPFRNHEFSHVYVYIKPVEIADLKLQEDEVESVIWMNMETLSRQVHLKNPAYCIMPDEIEQLFNYVPAMLSRREDAVAQSLTETWAEDAQQDLEDWIEEQGIYLRQ